MTYLWRHLAELADRPSVRAHDGDDARVGCQPMKKLHRLRSWRLQGATLESLKALEHVRPCETPGPAQCTATGRRPTVVSYTGDQKLWSFQTQTACAFTPRHRVTIAPDGKLDDAVAA